jgi:hypothetical protein
MPFWLDDPSELVSADLLPAGNKPVEERLNSFVRLSLVVFVITLVLTRQSSTIAIPAIAMIASVYMERSQNSCVKTCLTAGSRKEGFQAARSTRRKKTPKKVAQKKKFRPAKGCGLPVPDAPKRDRDILGPSVRNKKIVGESTTLPGMCTKDARDGLCEEPMVDDQSMVELLNKLSGRPVPFNYKYSPVGRNSIGATKRQCEYMNTNKNTGLGTIPSSREESMAELMANRMRSDNLAYCDNPDFDAGAVWGTMGRSLGGYKIID